MMYLFANSAVFLTWVKPMLKNTDLVMASRPKIDIRLAKNLLKIDTKRIFKGRIV